MSTPPNSKLTPLGWSLAVRSNSFLWLSNLMSLGTQGKGLELESILGIVSGATVFENVSRLYL
jgi:hypothetical protein